MHELDHYDVVDDDEFWHRVAADCTERAFVFFVHKRVELTSAAEKVQTVNLETAQSTYISVQSLVCTPTTHTHRGLSCKTHDNRARSKPPRGAPWKPICDTVWSLTNS